MNYGNDGKQYKHGPASRVARINIRSARNPRIVDLTNERLESGVKLMKPNKMGVMICPLPVLINHQHFGLAKHHWFGSTANTATRLQWIFRH